jgi:hypothetical protein
MRSRAVVFLRFESSAVSRPDAREAAQRRAGGAPLRRPDRHPSEAAIGLRRPPWGSASRGSSVLMQLLPAPRSPVRTAAWHPHQDPRGWLREGAGGGRDDARDPVDARASRARQAVLRARRPALRVHARIWQRDRTAVGDLDDRRGRVHAPEGRRPPELDPPMVSGRPADRLRERLGDLDHERLDRERPAPRGPAPSLEHGLVPRLTPPRVHVRRGRLRRPSRRLAASPPRPHPRPRPGVR